MQKSKKGGNLTNELSKLTIPFRLVLAQKSLESYLNKTKNKTGNTKKIVVSKQIPKTPYKGKKQPISNQRKKTLVTSV